MNNSNCNSNYNFHFQLQGSMDRSRLHYPAMPHQTSANTNWVHNNNRVDNNDQFSSRQFNSQPLNSQQSNLQPLDSQWPNSQQFLQGSHLQGLPSTMGSQPQGNTPRGRSKSHPFYSGFYPSSSPPIEESTEPNAWEQHLLLLQAQWRASRLRSHGLYPQSGNPNQLYSHQPVQPVLPMPQPYARTQQHSWPVELDAPHSGVANQLGFQQPVQPVQPVLPHPQPFIGIRQHSWPAELDAPQSGGINQLGLQEPIQPVLPLAQPYAGTQQHSWPVELDASQSDGANHFGLQQPVQPSPQTQPYCQPHQYCRLAEQVTQPSDARTGDSSENQISVENDGAENPAVPQSTAVDCEPTNTTALAVVTAPARIHALDMYYEVTALIQAQKWEAAPLGCLRETLRKAVQYWPGEYDCGKKRWFLHKQREESFYCEDRWGTGARTWGWLINQRIKEFEESVAKERESLLVAPINGVAPVNNNQRKRSRTSDSDAGSESAAKRAKNTNKSSARGPFSEPTPATAAPKKYARRKSSAQVAPKRASKKASTQAATLQAGPTASGESKISNQPKAPRARRNKKSGTEAVADLAPVSVETSAEPSVEVETSAASPAPVAEAAASQASTEPDSKESRAVEVATADSVPAEESDCFLDALFEEKPEPLQEQTDVPAEKEAAVEEALPAKDVEPEHVESKAVEPEDAEPEDDPLGDGLNFHLDEYFKSQGPDEVAENDEEPSHEPELSHEPTSEVCLAIDEEESSHEPTNDVYLAVDEESEISEEE